MAAAKALHRPVTKRHEIALIDANSLHRDEAAQALLSFYIINSFTEAESALSYLSLNPPNLALVGHNAGTKEGVTFIRAMRKLPGFRDIPILYIADRHDRAIDDALAVGANGYLIKPYRRSALIQAISSKLNAAVERDWKQLAPLPRQALTGTVETFNAVADIVASGEPLPYHTIRDACAPLVAAVNKNDFKAILNGVKDHDNYTYAHSMRVATLLSLFGIAVGLSSDEQALLASGGLLHDIGKMAIPHQILNKPGRLTENEFTVMKSHVTETVKLLLGGDYVPKSVVTIAAQHHEHVDGSGYPHGLKGRALNDLARMVAIVDVFSALTDRRVYKEPLSAARAIGIMTESMQGHLDMHFLGRFKAMLLDAVE